MTETIHLALPYLAAAQAQKHVTYNETLNRLDAVVQLAVLDATSTAPPVSPSEGDRHIVADGASGAWEDHDGELAVFVDGAWMFVAPAPGWVAFDIGGEGVLVRHDGAWVGIGTFLGPITRLGVNAVADDTNRLAVRTSAALLVAPGVSDGGSGDIRLTIDKEASADTASLVFQSGFSGRAEIGLAGDDDLVIKVSEDGTDWTEAIRVDRTSGVPSILYDNSASGLVATTIHEAIDEIADGSVLGPASATDGVPALFDGTSGRLIKATSFASFKTALALVKADVGLGNVRNVPQREKLSANRTYYVRTDGSDGNDGLTNNSGGAFATIQKAVDTVATLDIDGYTATVQIGDGTYTEAVVLPNVVGQALPGNLIVQGNTGDDDAVIVKANNTAVFTADSIGSIWRLRYIKIVAVGNGGRGLYANGPGTILQFENVVFGRQTSDADTHMFATLGGCISATGNYAIDGNAAHHMWARYGGVLSVAFITVTIRASLTFSSDFANADTFSFVLARSNTYTLGGNTVTGTRYVATNNSVLMTFGGGASYFPGNSAGSTANGGLYA